MYTELFTFVLQRVPVDQWDEVLALLRDLQDVPSPESFCKPFYFVYWSLLSLVSSLRDGVPMRQPPRSSLLVLGNPACIQNLPQPIQQLPPSSTQSQMPPMVLAENFARFLLMQQPSYVRSPQLQMQHACTQMIREPPGSASLQTGIGPNQLFPQSNIQQPDPSISNFAFPPHANLYVSDASLVTSPDVSKSGFRLLGQGRASNGYSSSAESLPIKAEKYIVIFIFTEERTRPLFQKLDISWWEEFINEFFTPSAIMKITLGKDNQGTEAKPVGMSYMR
jgi:hypothetical protein